MPDTPSTRRQNFDQAVEDYDAKALEKCVDFVAHRYLTVERDGYTKNRYAKGHRTLRGACDYLASVREEAEPFIPELVLDLETGERFELDVIAFVAPKHLDAVAVMMPRRVAQEVIGYLEAGIGGSIAQAASLFRKAITRR